MIILRIWRWSIFGTVKQLKTRQLCFFSAHRWIQREGQGYKIVALSKFPMKSELLPPTMSWYIREY